MSFIKDSILLIIGFVIKLIFSLLIDRFIATNILPDLYGMYKYSVTIATLFSSIAGLGFQSSIVRTISINKNNNSYIKKVITHSLFLILFSIIILFFIINTAVFYNIFNVSVEVFGIIAFAIIGLTLNQFIVGIFSGLKDVKVKIIVNDIFQPLLFFVLLFLFSNSINVLFISKLFVWSILISAILNLFFANKKLVSLYGSFTFKEINSNISIRDYYKYTLPILVTTIFIGFALSADKIVLSEIINAEQIGLYFSAFTLSNILGFILTSLLFLFLPVASTFYGKGKFLGGSLVSAYISKWLMLVSFIPFWLLFNYSEDILIWVYSIEYKNASYVLKILAVAGYINVSVGFTGQSLLALGDSYSQMIIRFVGVAATLLLAYILGEMYGINGVAISVLLSLLITNSLQVSVAFFKYKVALIQKINIYTYLFILIVILSLCIGNKVLIIDNFLLSYTVDIVFYCLMIFVFKIINIKDYRTVKLIH
mgnify:CR=1 FL=1